MDITHTKLENYSALFVDCQIREDVSLNMATCNTSVINISRPMLAALWGKLEATLYP